MSRRQNMKRSAAATRKPSNGVDADVVNRRRREVNRLRADGYTQREIADILLDVHTNSGGPLFTFMSRSREAVCESTLTREQKRDRAFATVPDDVAVHRKESQAEQSDAERLADDRYLLAERLRIFLKRLILRMEGNPAANPPTLGERSRHFSHVPLPKRQQR